MLSVELKVQMVRNRKTIIYEVSLSRVYFFVFIMLLFAYDQCPVSYSLLFHIIQTLQQFTPIKTHRYDRSMVL